MIYSLHKTELPIRTVNERKVAHILNTHVQRGCEIKCRRVRGLGPAACCVTDSLVFLHVKDVHFIDVLSLFRSPLAVGDCAMCRSAHASLSIWPPKWS